MAPFGREALQIFTKRLLRRKPLHSRSPCTESKKLDTLARIVDPNNAVPEPIAARREGLVGLFGIYGSMVSSAAISRYPPRTR